MDIIRPLWITRHSHEVIDSWQKELCMHFGCSEQEFAEREFKLRLHDFTSTVRIELADSSLCEFYHAFVLVSSEKQSVAIFTEHCGHHVFTMLDTRIMVDGELFFEEGS